MEKHGRGVIVRVLSVASVVVLVFLSRVPFPVLTRLGAWLGLVYFYLDRRRKRIGLENLRLAFGQERSDEELKRLLRNVYRNMGSSALEFAALPRLTREKLDRFVRMEGLEKIDKARQAGRGVILLTAHFGNWELLAQSLALHGHTAYGIGRQANVPLLNNFIVRCREAHGNRVIIRDRAMRKILRVLKDGEILGVLGDQRGSTSQGLMIDFFERPAPTNPDIARIIQKTGATVLTVFIVRNADQTHTVQVGDPLRFDVTGDPEGDVLAIAEQCMKSLESFIRQYPDHWLWLHRRWSIRGSGTDAGVDP
jgi:KDO2-lipid IV(A) lauroyltransferase